MPKVKTHSSCKKRFKKSCKGKIKRAKAYKRHHAWAKTKKQKRGLKIGTYIESSFSKKISTLIPY